jgi:hypothetical protein
MRPHAASNLSTPEGDIEMAHKINNINKIAFSRNIEETAWQNSKTKFKTFRTKRFW